MNRFSNKVCLVTGGTQGIGLGIALRFAEEGATAVVICSRKEANVSAAVKEIQAKAPKCQVDGIVCNVGVAADRVKMIAHIKDKYGKLDVLVPNAAVSSHFGNQMDITERAYDKLWDLNVKSTFFLIAECMDLLKEAGPGRNIMVVSSVTGTNPNWTIGVYAMTKAALDNMVRWLAQELMADDIRVTGIAPGLIKTEFSGALWKENDGVDPKAMGTPAQIAGLAATMCSEDGAFINGETY